MSEYTAPDLSEERLKQAAEQFVRQGVDIRERVHDLTLNALQSRRFDRDAMRDVFKAITSGVAVSPSSTALLSAARYPNNAPGAPPADHCRIGSPCGGSILTTSAPASVNILPQYDAAIQLDNSTIRQPANGAIASPPSATRSTVLSCRGLWHGRRSRWPLR